MRVRAAVAAAALAAVVGACSGGDDEQGRKADEIPRGGTLRIGWVGDAQRGEIPTIDPSKVDFAPPITELHRCCLLRTLVNYRGATERVVPWVPYLYEGAAQVVSDRVARFKFAQSSLVMMPAIDQIALKEGRR